MKKQAIIALAFIPFLVIGFMISTASASGISIIVNGSPISSDVPPQIINGSTMVPVRVISEALGASVSWDSTTQTVTLLGNGVHIAMTLGGYTLKNGSPITLDNPAQLINGRVMVPIRFIVEAFGCQVNWNANNQEVDISSSSAEPQTSSSGTTTTPEQTPEVSQPSTINPPTVAQPQAATPNNPPALTNPQVSLTNLTLVADDDYKTFLGDLNTNQFDPNGVYNEFGNYGNKFSPDSIWNQFGNYGNPFSQYSPFNQFTSTPPMIINGNGQIVGRLTVNQFVTGAVSPYQLNALLQKLGD